MKVAISTDNNAVSAHFGRCPSFTIIEIKENEIVSKEVIDNPGHHPGFLPQFLAEKNVEAIIAGGMGHRAQDLFSDQNIKTILGIEGTIDTVVNELIKGALKGGESLCSPGAGKGYGLDKTECTHSNADGEEQGCHHEEENKIETSQKICISSEGESLEANVDPRFGRCSYFIFINPATLMFEALENPYKNSTGGAGIQAGQFVADKKIDAVLTGNVGPNASKTLEAAGITVICNVSGTISQAVDQYKKGILKPTSGPSVESHFGIKT
ncbi:MAG: NifB/NifX family molybdenum-iron cluster-binding protein [Candidatus Nanoarchaeia archaeon]|nr:NifB/NifX family molybdenum-iron cluster-binding protein [Candidatus Nanoarchaeia archaeon]